MDAEKDVDVGRCMNLDRSGVLEAGVYVGMYVGKKMDVGKEMDVGRFGYLGGRCVRGCGCG